MQIPVHGSAPGRRATLTGKHQVARVCGRTCEPGADAGRYARPCSL
jgi:hypothetical protein